MARNLLLLAVLPTCIALQLTVLPVLVSGEALFGAVGGVTRNSADGRPVSEVRITAHNIDKGTDTTAVSGTDGTFFISSLEPGQYQLAAARDGFNNSTSNLEIAAPGTNRVNFLLASNGQSAAETNASPAKAGASDSAITDELEALKMRIAQLEQELHARTAPAAAPSQNQGSPLQVADKSSTAPQGPPIAPPVHRLPEALEAPDSTRAGQLHSIRVR